MYWDLSPQSSIPTTPSRHATSPAPRPRSGARCSASALCRQREVRSNQSRAAYAGLWQPWHIELVRPAWSAGIFGAPLAPVAWQLVQSVKGAATGCGIAGIAPVDAAAGLVGAGAAAVVGAAAGLVGAAAAVGAVVGAVVGATVGAVVGATVGAVVGAVVGATVGAVVAAGAAAGALVAGAAVGAGAAAGEHAAAANATAISEMPRNLKYLLDFTTTLPWNC